MKKNFVSKVAAVFAATVFLALTTACSLFNPVSEKKFTTDILGGIEYGYSFNKDGTYEEFSELGTIDTGTYSWDGKTKTVTIINAENETTAFVYDSDAKTIEDTSSIIHLTFDLKAEEPED